MPLLTAAGVNYIGVRDLASASTWYMEKLGLRKIEVEMDESEDLTPTPAGCFSQRRRVPPL